MENVLKVIQRWGFKNAELAQSYNVSGSRIVCRITTEIGEFIIKGIPDEVDEAIIISNTKAHIYLGNQKGLAGKLIPLPDGSHYIKEDRYYFYLLEYIMGRRLQATQEDEYLLGQAAAQLHQLTDYEISCSFDSEEEKMKFLTWFPDRHFKAEYDAIIKALPNFKDDQQCFIHTDIGPHNAVLNQEGKAVFVDLDDSGIGSKYIDLGWPFIMQFVDFNKETHEMKYQFPQAVAFLKGYYQNKALTQAEIDMIWKGAIYMHISYMQCYGEGAVESLWKILRFGMEQKDKVYQKFMETLVD